MVWYGIVEVCEGAPVAVVVHACAHVQDVNSVLNVSRCPRMIMTVLANGFDQLARCTCTLVWPWGRWLYRYIDGSIDMRAELTEHFNVRSIAQRG